MNNDETCYDFDYTTRRPTSRDEAGRMEKTRREADRKRDNAIDYLTLLCQGGSGGPVTEVSAPINGDFIENDYKALFTNTTNNPIRVQVFAEFVTPGCGAILSLSRSLSDVDKYDVLSLTANGRTESVTLILIPTYSIWVRDFNAAAFPMGATDILRIRVFDPMKMISYLQMYPIT